MISVDIVIETTWAASTSYILLEDGYPGIEGIPTTQYVQGGAVISPIYVRNSKTEGVQFTSQLVRYNILKLHYDEVDDLNLYVGLSERP